MSSPLCALIDCYSLHSQLTGICIALVYMLCVCFAAVCCVCVLQVHYSIGKAGRYLLHVRLHTDARPLPNSPFALTVVPGSAHGSTTKLTPESQPLRGEVGLNAAQAPDQPPLGCSLVLRTADRSGNHCIKGGATVTVTCVKDTVKCACVDQGDGSYVLSWHSKASTNGIIDTHVKVGGVSVIGSPMRIQLISTVPERTKTEAISLGSPSTSGEVQRNIKKLLVDQASAVAGKNEHPLFQDLFGGVGLRTAVAGESTSILLRFRDEFGNPATPNGDKYKIGLAISNNKLKVLGGWQAHDSLAKLPCAAAYVLRSTCCVLLLMLVLRIHLALDLPYVSRISTAQRVGDAPQRDRHVGSGRHWAVHSHLRCQERRHY